MARHAADFRYYEDFQEMAARYRQQGLTELLKVAEKGMARRSSRLSSTRSPDRPFTSSR